MSRTPENENIIRNENQTMFGNMEKELGTYNQNLGTLERGGQVGANPYQSPSYLANVNKEQADTLDAATNAGKTALQDQNRRAGGGNTGATTGAIEGLALNKARLASRMSTDRSTADFGKNLDWQKYLTSAPLAPYGAQAGVTSSTAGDLSQYALAQQQQWYKELAQMEQVAKTAASAGVSGATGGAGVGGFGEG